MTILRTIVSLNPASGKEEDSVQNSFTFMFSGTQAPTGVQLAAIHNNLNEFYNVVPASSSLALCGFIGTSISRVAGAHRMTTYQVSGAPGQIVLGPPIDEFTFALGVVGAGATNIPNECAVTLSFHAQGAGLPEHAPGGARPKARTRGRIYLGPLATNSIEVETTTNRVVVSQGLRTTLASSAARMLAAFQTAGISWAVYSVVNANANLIIGGHVDDAFDTIRSRGQDPVLKTPFGALSGRTFDSPEPLPAETPQPIEA